MLEADAGPIGDPRHLDVLTQASGLACEETMLPSLKKAFLNARLISGGAARAEQAVLNAIAKWEDGATLDRLVLREAIELAGAPGSDADLPAELQAVSALPSPLRESFILRMLAGVPGDEAAGLLNVEPSKLEDDTTKAVIALADRPDAGVGESSY